MGATPNTFCWHGALWGRPGTGDRLAEFQRVERLEQIGTGGWGKPRLGLVSPRAEPSRRVKAGQEEAFDLSVLSLSHIAEFSADKGCQLARPPGQAGRDGSVPLVIKSRCGPAAPLPAPFSPRALQQHCSVEAEGDGAVHQLLLQAAGAAAGGSRDV